MALPAQPDYYKILGISRTATDQEILDAFEKLAKEFQACDPPQNIDEVEKIRTVVTAYRVLSNAERRCRYDQFGYGFIGDENNQLAANPDKLDELLKWIKQRREDSGSIDFYF